MQHIFESWCVQIDVTNYCNQSCLYCSRYNRHLKKEQRAHMPLEQFVAALDSLRHWPKKIGIIGGEPLLHPQFRHINLLLRKHFPREKLGLWTSGLPRTALEDPRTDSDIMSTYGFIAYNPHTPEQQEQCKHQPLTVAIREVVSDSELMWKLIDNCWVQRTWCATITHKGTYFCEVAAAQDLLLNDGANAWPIEPGWWKRHPSEFRSQVEKLCPNCGMCIPMERELLHKKTEKFTPLLLQNFRDKNLRLVRDKDVEVFGETFSKEDIRNNIKTWYPGNYRGDLEDDNTALEGLGFTGKID